MSDLLLTLANTPGASKLIKTIGLPSPVKLPREKDGFADKPLLGRQALLITPLRTKVQRFLKKALDNAGAQIISNYTQFLSSGTQLSSGNTENSAGKAPLKSTSTQADGQVTEIDIVVLDTTGFSELGHYRHLLEGLQPALARLTCNARILLIANPPEHSKDPVQSAISRGIEGFMRSLAKEVGRKGATANLLYVAEGAENRLEMPVRFFCSQHSAYISGQPLVIDSDTKEPESLPLTKTLQHKIALVTGSAGGIGAETAIRLAQEGANVICLDVPAAEEALNKVAEGCGGMAITLDITQDEAPEKLAEFLQNQGNNLDILVHNAGITRDKSLAKMPEHYWDAVIAVNLRGIVNIDQCLLQKQLLNREGRIICLSSISGIAGNFGQTNYAATKAALIGYVAAQSRRLADLGITVNAVAPGFIETQMTASIPVLTREAGRRLNALSQGGLPRDVAEAIAFFASPGACGISGQTLRVCGQGIMGA